MMTDQEFDNKLAQLAEQLEKLQEQEDAFFSKFGITLLEMQQFAENPDNFTEEDWKKLCEERQSLEAKVQSRLAYVRDQRSITKAYKGLKQVQQHWIHVR